MSTKQQDKSSVILEIFSKHSVSVESNLEQLHKDLLFLENAINLVIGESKAGKTYTTIKSLVDAGLKDRVIHLDFDRNADSKLESLGVETYHIGDTEAFLNAFLDVKPEKLLNSLTGKILVIDSLQDLSGTDGYDSNKDDLKTMNRVVGFKDTGATVIVIHHVTLDSNKTFKVKGNATTITSKCDTTLTFTRDGNTRTFTVMNTRAEDKIATGTIREYKAKSKKKSKKNEAPE